MVFTGKQQISCTSDVFPVIILWSQTSNVLEVFILKEGARLEYTV